MGYTHYFPQRTKVNLPTSFSADQWAKIMEDAKQLIYQGVQELIDLEFEFLEDRLVLNGVGAEAHEDFVLSQNSGGGFRFCKTAHKPYDLVVCAILLLCHDWAPGVLDIGSDGARDYEENWKPAEEFFKRALGRKPSGLTEYFAEKYSQD